MTEQTDNPFAELEAQQEAELKAEADKWDLTPDELTAARGFGIEPDEWRVWASGRDINTIEAGLAEVKAKREAKAEAEQRQRVDDAAKQL